MNTQHYDTIIVGGGPAGLTAGIYLSRAKLKTLILNEGIIGGQMVLTHEIANYPGVESINGFQLATIMKNQAKSFGCDIQSNIGIKNIDLSKEIKLVELDDNQVFTSDSLILATGGRSRTLGIKGEEMFKGKGISYCATCDGDFFTDKEIVVVGGGNSALEEAVSLTKYASKVTIVHQFNHFQAFESAIIEATSNPKINFIMESTLVEYHGTENIESVDIKNIQTGSITNFPTNGVFIFIGYIPNTEFLKGKIEMNRSGEIIVHPNMSTNIPGVFAAGDSIAKTYRQITTAVGEGTIAALATSSFVNEKKTHNNLINSN